MLCVFPSQVALETPCAVAKGIELIKDRSRFASIAAMRIAAILRAAQLAEKGAPAPKDDITTAKTDKKIGAVAAVDEVKLTVPNWPWRVRVVSPSAKSSDGGPEHGKQHKPHGLRDVRARNTSNHVYT